MLNRLKDRHLTATATLFPSDEIITVDTTAGNVTLTLPGAAGCRGLMITVKRLSAGANTLTIAAAGTDLIDGASSTSLPTQYDAAILAAVLTASPNTYGWVLL